MEHHRFIEPNSFLKYRNQFAVFKYDAPLLIVEFKSDMFIHNFEISIN